MFQNVPHLTCPNFPSEVYECFIALKIKEIPDLKLAITTQCNSEHCCKGFNVVREQADKTVLTLTNDWRTLCSCVLMSYAEEESCASSRLLKGTVL